MIQGSDFSVHVLAIGDRAACLQLPTPCSGEAQTRLLVLAQRLRDTGRFVDVVPGWGNLTVLIDPARDEVEPAQVALLSAWRAQAEVALPAPRERVLRVRYGGEHGPDLPECAARSGLSEAEFIARHSAAAYTVAFIGFQPGFAYLMGLPEALHQPRRAEPRLRVPAGSVAIGGGQAGVYPAASPGGWQLIGHTDQVLFDPHAPDPGEACWWQPGDRVRFQP
jgi:KipI family sensor histidine kinase inhibitor